MAKEKIIAPEVSILKADEFYLLYEMMIQPLKTDDVKEALNIPLHFLRMYLRSGNIALFKKNEEGSYMFCVGDSDMSELIKPVGCIINKTKPIIEQRGQLYLDLNLSDRLRNMELVNISIEDKFNEKYECILVVLNTVPDRKIEPIFWERVKNTFTVILKRAASYERNIKAATTDLLTGLQNRNSYENSISSLDENSDNLVVGVFDLLRLKRINDTYSHLVGDRYIRETAKILKKYWPSKKRINADDFIETYEPTGHTVYKYGGDEYVLLTTIESLELANIKANLASEEASMIDLGVGDNPLPVGLNFGLAKHIPGTKYEETFNKADELMRENKSAMVKRLNLDDRRYN